MNEWGLLPQTVIARIRRREWSDTSHLRGRLSGHRPFPLKISLKAPTGSQALSDLDHFKVFIDSWKNWPHPNLIQWQLKKFQRLGEQRVPIALQVDSMIQLISLLGKEAEARSRRWEQLMRPLLKLDSGLSDVLVQQLTVIEKMSADDTFLLAKLLPQLRQGMGQGSFLRALPVKGVDTKFIENYQALISSLLDHQHNGAVGRLGGLLAWLECRPVPVGWLLIRPLCQHSRKKMAGLPILQVDSRTLPEYPLPASRILIVENKQSGYALPLLEDTIAVFGGGRNISWMQAEWLHQKQIGYWGDIDSWGLAILSDARRYQPHLQALMMDQKTVQCHRERMGVEKEPCRKLPADLTEEEMHLFQDLASHDDGHRRLEQERLNPDYIAQQLKQWWQTTITE